MLGVSSNVAFKSVHFTSMGLFEVSRIARQARSQLIHLKKLEVWINSLFNSKAANTRFMETFNLESTYED